jgi:hypothetical protein
MLAVAFTLLVGDHLRAFFTAGGVARGGAGAHAFELEA